MDNYYHMHASNNWTMDRKEIIKNQFDLQAQRFSDWSVTKNEEYSQAYFEFIGL